MLGAYTSRREAPVAVATATHARPSATGRAGPALLRPGEADTFVASGCSPPPPATHIPASCRRPVVACQRIRAGESIKRKDEQRAEARGRKAMTETHNELLDIEKGFWQANDSGFYTERLD